MYKIYFCFYFHQNWIRRMLWCWCYCWILEIRNENIHTKNIKTPKNQIAPTGQKHILYGDVVQVLRYMTFLVSFLHKFCPALIQFILV